MTTSGVYVSPVYNGQVRTVRQEDAFGTVYFHLLPFVKPAQVRGQFKEQTIETYTDAVRAALSGINLEDGNRHVLLAHQFVTGSERCDSEEVSVGGSDNVDAEVFRGFDYVALGLFKFILGSILHNIPLLFSHIYTSFSESAPTRYSSPCQLNNCLFVK